MDLQKIYSDSDFENAVVPEGQILVFNGTENGKPVTRYKDSSGNFGTVSGSGSEGMDFYKCASVDTAAKTWTGYKAVLTDGVYTFEETVTAGLIYGTAFTPTVNKIYNADATVAVSGLYEGSDPNLVFYAPLETDASTITGQVLTAYGSVSFTPLSGRSCVYFPSNTDYLTLSPLSGLSGSLYTISAWIYFDDVWNALNAIINYGSQLSIQSCDSRLRVYMPNNSVDIRCDSLSDKTWIHVAVTSDGENVLVYLNGESEGTSQTAAPLGESLDLKFGGSRSGALSDVRIYNRCLTAEEIAELANN